MIARGGGARVLQSLLLPLLRRRRHAKKGKENRYQALHRQRGIASTRNATRHLQNATRQDTAVARCLVVSYVPYAVPPKRGIAFARHCTNAASRKRHAAWLHATRQGTAAARCLVVSYVQRLLTSSVAHTRVCMGLKEGEKVCVCGGG